ncbi:hypothetical protein JCM5296_002418 [Sporobolomyces johnsonii]
MPDPTAKEPKERKYAVLIELYDHTAALRSSSPSPLYPTTSTRLPPALDKELQATQHRLVLPQTSSSFWKTRLPATRKLDTHLPSTLSAAGLSSSALPSPPLESRPPSAPRIWSESFGLPSPPAIATAELWTPSKAGILPTASAQQACLDFRFGPLACDWINDPESRPTPPSMPSAPLVSPPLVAAQLPSTPKPESASPPRAAETSGTTDLYWGTIHLYREAGANESSKDEKRKAREEDDGTTVGLVSVPGVLNAAALLSFIAPALENVAQVRMLRDATPNRSLVLIRFHEAAVAAEFKRMYNGKPYHDSKDSEVCHVVSISSIKLKTSSHPPFTFPVSPSDVANPAGSEMVELPTCPICLERLDVKVSGLVQIMCQHSYHCSCLLKWGDSRCPVCRSTNARTRRNSLSSPPDSKCAVCQSPSNLWICVICGNVGCGRYQGGHAHSHFGETGHSYSLELETGRIWSYTDDEYVHRLLRMRATPSDPTSPDASGRLIELPSLATSRGGADEDISSKIASSASNTGGGGGPDRTAELEQGKLEALALEYGNLMSSHLSEQREYFEDELAREKDLVRMSERKRDEVVLERDRARRDKSEVEKRLRELEAGWTKERKELEARIEQVRRDAHADDEVRKKERAEWARARKALERELEAERAVTASLTANLGALRTDMARQKHETDTVRGEVAELQDQLNDLMAALSMRDRVAGTELEGGSLGVAAAPAPQATPTPSPSAVKAAARKKKKK